MEPNIFYPANWRGDQHWGLRQYFDTKYRYLVCKRIFDTIASILVMALVFPWLVPILMILIKLDSKGPAFFKQKRIGFLGKTFWCYKFRTMYVNDTADTRRSSKNDPRVTRIGRFLRNSCLDEIPQFVNVFLGNMSIVGPRPHMLKDTKEFSAAVDNYKFRNRVRPGITGISQVRGYRGPAVTFESIFRRYQWDAYYVRNVNFILDCKIMVDTCTLIVRSLFHKDKPVPLDSSMFHHESKSAAKKIA
jgi:putative colanic acid biosynthesis UDP-glucose lipid carrier transferase